MVSFEFFRDRIAESANRGSRKSLVLVGGRGGQQRLFIHNEIRQKAPYSMAPSLDETAGKSGSSCSLYQAGKPLRAEPLFLTLTFILFESLGMSFAEKRRRNRRSCPDQIGVPMDIKRFTLIMGIIFLAVGALGFVPQLVTQPVHSDPAGASHGLLLGLFPINGLHNLVHIAFGFWALWTYKEEERARTFCRTNSVIYGLLAVLGALPASKMLFGILPIYGHDVWLHGAIALATGYFGFVWHRHSQLGRQS